jgi:hypothetical protein
MLIDVSAAAGHVGFQERVLLSPRVWDDCVAWPLADFPGVLNPDEESRLLHLVIVATQAVDDHPGSVVIYRDLFRIRHQRPQAAAAPCPLKIAVGNFHRDERTALVLLAMERIPIPSC